MEELKRVVVTFRVSGKSKKVYLSLVNRLGKLKLKFPSKKMEKESYVSVFLSQFPYKGVYSVGSTQSYK